MPNRQNQRILGISDEELMYVKDTCLFSFFEYIFKEWIQNSRQLPEYDDVFGKLSAYSSQGEVIGKLDNRRREIWNKTKALFELEQSQARIDKLKEYQEQNSSCDLCMKCIGCEREYWTELEKVLYFHDEEEFNEKSMFMLPHSIQRLLEQQEKPVEIYLDRHKRRNFLEKNCLLILKAFSSSMPILLNYSNDIERYSGGGFYIRWNGKGIAVDPGYKFVENLHRAGFSVLDVDVVVVTHEHIDHSSDIRLLDDLHFNASKNHKDQEYNWNPEGFYISKDDKIPHKISWYLDPVTYETVQTFADRNSGFSPLCNILYCVSVDQFETERLKKVFPENRNILTHQAIQIGTDIVMQVFPTCHEQKNTRTYFGHTFGCTFECMSKDRQSIQIGYTSDTSINEVSVYDGMINKLQNCQIIIANISGIYEDDILLKNAKARHLGYYGCYKIAYDILKTRHSPVKYYLLSEFSNQVSDIRYDVSKYLQKELNKCSEQFSQKKPLVLPAEIELEINLNTFGVKCSSCGRCSENIHIIRPFGENQKLTYICDECLYSHER